MRNFKYGPHNPLKYCQKSQYGQVKKLQWKSIWMKCCCAAEMSGSLILFIRRRKTCWFGADPTNIDTLWFLIVFCFFIKIKILIIPCLKSFSYSQKLFICFCFPFLILRITEPKETSGLLIIILVKSEVILQSSDTLTRTYQKTQSMVRSTLRGMTELWPGTVKGILILEMSINLQSPARGHDMGLAPGTDVAARHCGPYFGPGSDQYETWDEIANCKSTEWEVSCGGIFPLCDLMSVSSRVVCRQSRWNSTNYEPISSLYHLFLALAVISTFSSLCIAGFKGLKIQWLLQVQKFTFYDLPEPDWPPPNKNIPTSVPSKPHSSDHTHTHTHTH